MRIRSARPAPRVRFAQRGFTLVEVLATLVLMGIIVPVAMQGISISLRAATHAKRTSEATILAETKLNDLVTTRTWSTVAANGDFGQDWPDYRWTCQSIARNDAAVTEVAVSVLWKERNSDRSVTVSTLVYEPDTTGGFP